jgi:hypothetical protein
LRGLLGDPLVQSALLPALATALLTGLIRLAGGRGRGPLLASAAIAAGFLLAYAAILGWPPLPPRASTQKIAYIALAGLALGAALDAAGAGRGVLGWASVALGTLLAVGWLYGRQLLAAPTAEQIALAAAVALGGLFLLARLEVARDDAPSAAVMLLVAAAGAAFVAVLGRSAALGQLAGALAAATGGFLLWNWPVARYRFGAAAVLGAGGALVAILASLAFFTAASRIALALLPLVFLADSAAARLPLGKKPALRPVGLGLVALVPAALAVAAAYLAADGGGSGYGGY